MHPNKQLLAVGACGRKPNVYLYEYPSMALSKVLKGGALTGFSSMSFTEDGTKLSTVGMKVSLLNLPNSRPDHT